MDLELWQIIIGLVVCLAVGIIGTIVVKNGWESKIIGSWEKMKVIYKNIKPLIESYDVKLAEELSTMFKTLEDAFADGGLTLAEFNDVLKSFKPLWNRILEIIENIKCASTPAQIPAKTE